MGQKERIPQFFVRNIEAENLLEMFFVAAVTSVLAIRFYLQLTGYPQLGGGSIHIAHVLWGGIFMLAAFVLMFGFLGNSVRKFAAILGGVGFGAFIDELGKFITRDQNYFFQPTVALIYIIFVSLYLVFRYISQFQSLSKAESLMNALELCKEAVLHKMDGEEKARLEKLLEEADPAHPIRQALGSIVQSLSVTAPSENLYEKGRRLVHNFHERLIRTSWFAKAVIFIFIWNSLFGLGQAVWVIWRTRGFSFVEDFSNLSFIEGGELISSALAGLLVMVGVVQMGRSRETAYQLFRYAILISIFVTNFFLFFQEQFGALVGLLGNILLLGILNYIIHEEVGQKTLQKNI